MRKMSQFRMRTSSASKSTQTESNVEQANVDNGEDDITDAVLPENADLENDDPKLKKTENSLTEVSPDVSKHTCPLNEDDEDDGLLALEETRC